MAEGLSLLLFQGIDATGRYNPEIVERLHEMENGAFRPCFRQGEIRYLQGSCKVPAAALRAGIQQDQGDTRAAHGQEGNGWEGRNILPRHRARRDGARTAGQTRRGWRGVVLGPEAHLY